MTLHRVDVWSFAKVFAVICAILALIGGVAICWWEIYLKAFTAEAPPVPMWTDTWLGVAFLIVIAPVLSLLGNFLVGLLLAAIYNFASWLVGGVRVILDDQEHP